MTVQILLEGLFHPVDVVLPQSVPCVLRAVSLLVLVEAADRWCRPGFKLARIGEVLVRFVKTVNAPFKPGASAGDGHIAWHTENLAVHGLVRS